ncbi:GPALPP motifs-containing protein 1 isoform X1 [Rhinichthys klamathensis goyatoka]|uniref:GPALPP motifs-containing protein 1 isoform X1 n=1 Tax=Rhinichthys klamathensis goyatoka TaxID=3034132 RepID=UPI0024B512FE|nr:GPALPP motifs-containing protein 1 isoform X1 [Rhinichthys klamathensis goyatoka]
MSNQNVTGPALPPSMGNSQNDDSDGEDAIIGPALPPLYKASESSSSCEDSDQEEVVFKRAKYSSSGNRSSLNNRDIMKAEMDIKQTEEKEEEEEDDDGFFGPALPPGYQKREKSPEEPPLLGPALPPGFKKQDEDGAKDDTRGLSGPALPSECRKQDKSPERRPPAVGPALPPGFKRQDEDEKGEKEDASGFLGPALPPGYTPELSSSEEDDDYVIGPMPSKGPSQDSVALDFERRAQKMKDKLTGVDTGPEVVSRESWMTELPPELQHVGLEARTFKKRSGPENKDRSIWTDTPAERERKARERQEAKEKGESAKDDGPRLPQKELEMAEKVSKYNESKRGESLISLHTKKMKRKAEEDADKPVERRPFDRDMDLQVNRFDEAQKKALLKKSQELNTRFSHSKDRMFL